MYNVNKTLVACAIAASLSICSSNAFAGNNNGSLKGSVYDSNKAAVAGAQITISNEDTGFKRTISAKEDGTYRFAALPVGSYKVTISKDGFKGYTRDDVYVSIGGNSISTPIYRVDTNTEVIEVVGRNLTLVDVTSSESALNISADELSRLPVARDITSVALLAPGATEGDSAFGKQASFGGSSVAENAYFVNGLNVTDFRNGIGGSTIPFEFYQDFQIKTGGYSAEFGRSTGGVINAVTKSGGNEFEFGANLFYAPESFGEQSPNILNRDGSMKVYNAADSKNSLQGNIYASGPIIEDTLFFYVLYNPRDITNESVLSAGTSFEEAQSDDAFWGGKLDLHLGEDHIVELTAFSDSKETVITTQGYDYKKSEFTDDEPVIGTESRGGENIAVKYTGYLTDDFTISALWGQNKADQTDVSGFDSNPVIYDKRSGNWVRKGSWANFQVKSAEDTRESIRIDGEYVLDDHIIRFGYDSETNTSFDNTGLSGGVYYAYFKYQAGEDIDSIGHTFTSDEEVVRVRHYASGGEFETLSNAFYIEDKWDVTENITATIGLRSESFNNKNAQGESFIKVDNQLAPRLGVAWDIHGDGESKLFANLGRYHLPVAANTNIRMAGAETYIHTYYILDGVNADDTPIYKESNKLGTQVNGDGTVPDVREVLDTSIKPMYQDELILGYETKLNEDWAFSVKYTYRDLKSIIDDVTIDKAIRANGWSPDSGNVYVLTNPNTNITTYYDTDGDGVLEKVNISADSLGYPAPSRKYHALDFNIKKSWNDVWSLDATYTWAHSYGNAEGYVKSDNGQDDAGLTTDWDFPYLMDGASGNLPNDRRHTFKVYGAYAITENLLAGINLIAQSGRPVSGFGHGLPEGYGDDFDKYEYGQTYYVGEGEENFVPRGSYGRTPWRVNFDASLKYNTTIGDADVTLAADVFNLLNTHNIREFDETYSDGTVNKEFLSTQSYYPARSVRFSATVRF